MEKVNPIGVTLDDIVFENRNKAYGAYALRQSYSDTVIRALLLSPLFALLLIGGPIGLNQLIQDLLQVPLIEGLTTPPPLIQPGIQLTELIIPPKPAAAQPAVKMVNNKPYEAVHDNLVDPKAKIPTEADFKDAISGPLTMEGDVADVPPLEFSDNKGGGTGLLTETAVVKDEPYIKVEEMPEFPGGQEALLKFIGKHLRYPASAQRNGVNGIVYVSFVISPAGKVTQVEILKGIDMACDAEAVRVITKLPDWKPGRQSGRTVPVRYSLPLRFTIQ